MAEPLGASKAHCQRTGAGGTSKPCADGAARMVARRTLRKAPATRKKDPSPASSVTEVISSGSLASGLSERRSKCWPVCHTMRVGNPDPRL